MRNILTLVLGIIAVTGILTTPDVGAPKPIKVSAPTVASIKEDMRIEKLAKRYAQATAVASKAFHTDRCRNLAELVGRSAVDFGVSPKLVAGVIVVESSCNPNAVSNRKSVGVMQLNCAVWKCSMQDMKRPELNIALGVKVLAGYVHRYGVVEGLHHYNGLGNNTNEYAACVLHAAGMLPKNHPIIPTPLRNNLTAPVISVSLSS